MFIHKYIYGGIGQNFRIRIKSTREVPCIILVILLQVEKLCQNKKLTLGSKNRNQYWRQTGQRRAAGGVLKCLGPQQVCCGEDGEMRRYFKRETSINVWNWEAACSAKPRSWAARGPSRGWLPATGQPVGPRTWDLASCSREWPDVQQQNGVFTL